MNYLSKKSRFRSATSTVLSLALLMTMIVIPAFGATPSTATLTSAGTTSLTSLMDNQASNGLNGELSIEVTGTTAATKSVLKGQIIGGATTLNDLFVNDFTTFKVEYDSVPTTITGLSGASTVSQVLAAINSQVATVTANFDTAGRIQVTSKQYTDHTIGVTDEGTNGIADVLFGPNQPYNDVAPPPLNLPYLDHGDNYSADFRAIYSFYDTNGLLVASGPATVGWFTGSNTASTGVDPTTNLYTSVKLPAGWDISLRTADVNTGMGFGTAKVTLGSGIRDAAAPSAFTVTPVKALPVQAGVVDTFTITLTGPASTQPSAAIAAANFTLPAGWSVPTTSAVTAAVGSTAASATITGSVISVSKFMLKNDQTLTVTIPLVKPSTVADSRTDASDDYAFTGEYRNAGTATFAAIEAPATTMNNKVHVAPENKVKTIDLKASGNRAGGISVATARVYDQYMNQLDNVEFPRTVNYSVLSTPVLSPMSTIAPAQATAWNANYGYKAEVSLSAQQGITNVQAVVTGEATATVAIDTTGVGDPVKLVLTSETNPQVSGKAVLFHLGMVDAAGKATSYLTGSHTYRLFYGVGGRFSQDFEIPAKYSEVVVSTDDLANRGILSNVTWDMWAVDALNGALTESAVLAQTWGAAPVEPGVYTDLKVSAAPLVPVKTVRVYNPANLASWVTTTNTGNFGYAMADGVSAVTFTVQTVDGNGIPIAKANVKVVVEDLDPSLPGKISSMVATTSASGIATFTVTSTYPMYADKDGAVFNRFKFTDEANAAATDNGWANFYAPIVKSFTTDKNIVLADGVAKATLTATLVDPIALAPQANAKVFFYQSGATPADLVAHLSATQGTTNASGTASIDVTSTDVGVAQISARDFSGINAAKTVAVRFTDMQAVLLGTASAQQSERGAMTPVTFQIRKLDGTLVSFGTYKSGDTITVNAAGGDTWEVGMAELETDTVSAYLVVDGKLVAGDVAKADIDGNLRVKGTFGYTDYYFAGEFLVTIVNNAMAAGADTVIPNIDGNLEGVGFRPADKGYCGDCHNNPPMSVQIMVGSKKVDIGYAWTDTKGTITDYSVNIPLVQAIPAGTYDLYVDGIKFVGKFRVVEGFNLGGKALIIRLYGPNGPAGGSSWYNPGTLKLSGIVTDLDGKPVPGAVVELWQTINISTLPAQATGKWMIANSNGQFSFSVNRKVTTYYKATTLGNALYGEGDSRDWGEGWTALRIKTRIVLAVPKVPATAVRNRAFTVAGVAPVHTLKSSVLLYVYNPKGQLYKKVYAPLYTNSRTYKASVVLPSAGRWKIRAVHSDYNHLASYSAFKYVTVR